MNKLNQIDNFFFVVSLQYAPRATFKPPCATFKPHDGTGLDRRASQNDINNMMRWYDANKLPVNINKCHIFTASRETIRDLGGILGRRFLSGDHIKHTTLKCRKLIACIRIKVWICICYLECISRDLYWLTTSHFAIAGSV